MNRYKDKIIINFAKSYLRGKVALIFFLFFHILLAIALGPFYVLAPDEQGYLYTLNNLFGESGDPNPQLQSGWISVSKPFLWISYLPAKIMILAGVPDYLSLRIISVLLGLLSVGVLNNLRKSSHNSLGILNSPILWFSVPSVFLWSTLGLRESFLFAETSLVLVGSTLFLKTKSAKYLGFIFIGSFGLLATKNYQWVLLVIAVILVTTVFLFSYGQRRQLTKLVLAFAIFPMALFLLTTPTSSLEFVTNPKPTEISQRSGDSTVEVLVPNDLLTGTETGVTVKIHGGTTLISLNQFLDENPRSFVATIMRITKIDVIIKKNFNKKVSDALEKSKSGIYVANQSYILNPSTFSHLGDLLRASLVFLLGPLPFSGEFLSTSNMLSFETPIWWFLLILFMLSFLKTSKKEILKDFSSLVAILYLGAVIITAGMFEVNLGTSFRHRSLILVPIIFLLIRFSQIKKLPPEKI